MFSEQKVSSQQNFIVGLLQGIDIFGVGINIRFNQQCKHKTGFGGFVTLALTSLLLILFIQSILTIINKSNPQVIFQQNFVSNPSRYNLTSENFSFAITLLDANFNPINDKSIFRFEGNFLYKEPQLNADGSEGPSVFKNKVIELELCTEQSFQVQGTESYFLSLQYQSMYCFKNISDYYLVGQFEMNEFSVIQINVIPCDQSDPNNQVQCMEESQKNQILSQSLLQVYYITQVVQVSSQQQPFKPMGITYFWENNISFLQNVNLMFMKTYIEDDTGLIFENNVQTSSLLFSSERTTMSSKKDYSIYQISLYLEKNKEQTYTRKYQKIFDCFSSIGGIYNVLFALGCIIAQPYSQIQLNRKLFNTTFQINKNQSDQQLNKSQNSIKSMSKKNQSFKDDKGIQEAQNTIEDRIDKFQIEKLERANQFFEDGYMDNNQISENYQKRKSILDSFKQHFTVIKIQTREYFSYYFNCFKSDMNELINYGTKQILAYTDICFIVNKLIELEKLKAILLNDEQIQLFDFIPKPQINIELIKGVKNINKRRFKSLNQSIQTQKTIQKQLKTQESMKNENQKRSQPFNILSVQNKSNYEKAKQAQHAFNSIYRNKQKQSKIDMKLIQLLDQDLIDLFDNNIFQERNLAGSIFIFNQSMSKAKQRDHSCSPIINNQDRFSRQFSIKSDKNGFQKTNNFNQEFKNKISYYEESIYEIQTSKNDEIIETDSILHNYNSQPKNFIFYTNEKNKVHFTNDQEKQTENNHQLTD
ncbi:ubiquitin-conjugating enzyme family protein (macronuclear) [Tetrahymena thermophila SB210]|uniref:Ubiquitin-conjugating enzyme family protein n=1 Tax=Tetrahymena thermophila (strain SB210) TaxID=312017 RepID=Q24CW9_TETTS|nr:ubiquitin-conjugating enzyme family protein [Tetrahymena thermophila SB210]EAS05639.2 ubiquitin-conjugating enzyme family protein [Tetrahymena thermophila SB210]|eukprot:XP_001025884.2 ubiquitin-conjugating enzyme family protein [Tetrahymena thermophila SB210]